jgi:hypothetical protein
MDIIRNIIDLGKERKKRLNPSFDAINLICALEEILEDAPVESYPFVLRKFVAGMDLGDKPITVLVSVCRSNPNILELIVGLLSDITADLQADILDDIEDMYPADKQAIRRFKMIIVTLHGRNLSLKKINKLFKNAESWLLSYILGEDTRFEQYALMSNANVIEFPKSRGRLHVIA